MHNTTFANFDSKPMIAFWLCLALAAGPIVADGPLGDDCDSIWSRKDGPLSVLEDCQFILGPGIPALPSGYVSQELAPLNPDVPALPTYEMGFRFAIDTSELVLRFGKRFGIFELVDNNSLSPQRMIYLELQETGNIESEHGVILRWQDDVSDGEESPLAIVDPGIAVFKVEWDRSYDADNDGWIDDNGAIRVSLNEVLIAEVTGLRFENYLPGSVSYGAFETHGENIEGRFKFRPVDFSVRYYRSQGPGSEMP